MSGRIHDEEADTSELAARRLLTSQCPEWAGCELSHLKTSGTDNAMWRIHVPSGVECVLRLPRTDGAGQSMARELVLLPELAGALSSVGIGTPIVTFRGNPTDEYPYPWAVLEWIPGDDAWTANRSNNRLTGSDPRLASDLAAAVLAIGATVGVSAPERKAGDRGGPLRRLLARLDWWLDEPRWGAEQLIDVPAVRRLAAESLEVADVEVSQRFVHGDLIPGNIIVADGRLSALIDWGSAAYADPAQDLSPAWSILDRDARNVFRHAVGADDASWLRARAFELEHAVGGILYYTPRKHPLADVMARTLHRILTNE